MGALRRYPFIAMVVVYTLILGAIYLVSPSTGIVNPTVTVVVAMVPALGVGFYLRRRGAQ